MPLQVPFAKLPLELQGSEGKYLIAREDNRDISHGYMSVIYKVRCLQTLNLLALKTIWLMKDPTSDEEENWKKAARQFQQEINTISKLKDIPGIIQVKDRGEYEGLPWYVMDYIKGSVITEGLKNKPLYDQVRILRKVVKALSQAHQKGIVHMDLKPSNILLEGNQEPIILDFGISRVVELAWESISISTGIFGTPRYMAPEQFGNSGYSTSDLHQVDIWAVGVLFYEILVEAHPLGVEDTDTYNMMVHKIINNEVRDLSSFGKEVDRALAEICYRALSKDKAHRYKNAAEMFHDLNQWETANFNKCMLLVDEYISYQHWPEAQKSALEAHRWSPYHPKIKEYLTKVLSGQYKVPVSIEWLETISPELFSLLMKTRRGNCPKAMAKIHYIHNEPPYFLAVDALRGIPLAEFLSRRADQGGAGILNLPELEKLLQCLKAVLDYAVQNSWTISGLQTDNIYCALNAADKIEDFQMWGIGWRGKPVKDVMGAIRAVVRQALADESIAVDPEIEQLLVNCHTIEEILARLGSSIHSSSADDLI